MADAKDFKRGNRMEIDFIKWLVGYAEGFELSLMSTDQISIEMIDIEKVVSFSTNIVMGNGDPESNEYWLKVYYPLLLQRGLRGLLKCDMLTYSLDILREVLLDDAKLEKWLESQWRLENEMEGHSRI